MKIRLSISAPGGSSARRGCHEVAVDEGVRAERHHEREQHRRVSAASRRLAAPSGAGGAKFAQCTKMEMGTR